MNEFDCYSFKKFQISLTAWMDIFTEITLNWLFIFYMEDKWELFYPLK